jgi:hypothetical protein
VLVVNIGDGLLEVPYFVFQQGLEVWLVLADSDASKLFVLVAFLIGDHHAEVFPE